MFMLSFIFVTSVWSYRVEAICAGFYHLFICVLHLEIQLSREEGWDRIV
jgi:hypothetical protein